MDGGEPPPPPRRKAASRFFAGGKSLIGHLPGTAKRRKTSDDHHSRRTLQNINHCSNLTQSQAFADKALPPPPPNADSFEKASFTFATAQKQQPPPALQVPGIAENARLDATAEGTPRTQTASQLENLSIKDRRRHGIYGAIPGMQAAGIIHDDADLSPLQTQINNSQFVLDLPTNPFHTVPFQSGQIPVLRSAPDTKQQYVPSNIVNYPANSAHSRPGGQSSQPGLIQPLQRPQWQLSATLLPPPGPFVVPMMPRQFYQPQSHQDSGPLSTPPPPVPAASQRLEPVSNFQPFIPPTLQDHPRAQLDVDRDVNGKRVPPQQLRPIANLPGTGISNLPLHATANPSRRIHMQSGVPANLYTSPNRIANAFHHSRNLKRKRQGLILPPPAYVYTRTNDPKFNVFSGLLLYPELCFHLAGLLPLKDLISLYAISRDFHTIIDRRFTTVILSQSLRKAPESSRTFPFRCYKHFCRVDPAARIPHPDPEKAARGVVRGIPSFKWLAMVIHREKVVHELMAIFAEDGVPLPARCSLALKRMWFMLDIPDNARRIGFIHNRNLFTDLDLYFAMAFFVKLDMRCNDPVGPEKRDGLKKLLLSQQSLSTVLMVLKGHLWPKKFNVLKAWIRYKYTPLADEEGVDIFGVPAVEVGKMKWEYWGKRGEVHIGRKPQWLLRPDQLVMREAIKRGMRFTKHFLRCMTYGYIRMDTLVDYAPRKYGRRIEGIKDEYGVDDEVGGLCWTMGRAVLDGEEEKRDMLDLGVTKEISLLCIQGGEGRDLGWEWRQRQAEEKEFLERCMDLVRREREWADVMDVDD